MKRSGGGMCEDDYNFNRNAKSVIAQVEHLRGGMCEKVKFL